MKKESQTWSVRIWTSCGQVDQATVVAILTSIYLSVCLSVCLSGNLILIGCAVQVVAAGVPFIDR